MFYPRSFWVLHIYSICISIIFATVRSFVEIQIMQSTKNTKPCMLHGNRSVQIKTVRHQYHLKLHLNDCTHQKTPNTRTWRPSDSPLLGPPKQSTSRNSTKTSSQHVSATHVISCFMTYSLEFGWFLLRSIPKYQANLWILCNFESLSSYDAWKNVRHCLSLRKEQGHVIAVFRHEIQAWHQQEVAICRATSTSNKDHDFH